MGRLLLAILLAGTGTASLARPMIGVVAAYLLVVLRPHAVWWWHFDGLRPALWILLPTIVGFAIAYFRNQIDLKIVRNRRSVYMILLWLSLTLSFYFGTYVDVGGVNRFTSASWAMSTSHKFFILYFLACACINSEKALNIFAYVIVASGIFFTYWINERYLFGGAFGRIGGPSGVGDTGMYADHNNFAMLFVVALPYLAYFGAALKNQILRWSVWMIIPLGWHGVFLTGSRGGLLGLGITLLIMVWRSKNKVFGFLLIPVFIGAFLFQAGDTMRDRASTITGFSQDSSASSRIQAWTAASKMIVDNPLTGVGIASFGPAFPYYSEDKPRETHNTYLQITSESGLIAGFGYAGVLLSCLFGLWRNGKILWKQSTEDDGKTSSVYWINEATLVALCGFAVCATFLSLQMFEIFWYLCVLTNALLFLTPKQEEPAPLSMRQRHKARLGPWVYHQYKYSDPGMVHPHCHRGLSS